MSFRKICEEDGKKNEKVIKGLKDACSAMRTILKGMNIQTTSAAGNTTQSGTSLAKELTLAMTGACSRIPDQGAVSDDSLLEDDYEKEKKIDEQFLRHKEILEKYEKTTSQMTENYELLRLNFSKIIGIILRISPSLGSLDELDDQNIRDSIHKRMDKIGMHAFYKKGGTRRFPLILTKIRSVMKNASEVLFDQPALDLQLSFNEKFRILKFYYRKDAKSGRENSPLRISGKGLLTVVDGYLAEHRENYKRSKQMRKLLKEAGNV